MAARSPEQLVTNDRDVVLGALAHYASQVGPLAIGVDGADGVGKSTLASYLAERLALQLVDLDDYLERDDGAYVSALNIPKLEAICERRTRRVLCGLCLLDIAERLGLEFDTLVYLRRWNKNGWPEDEELFDERSIADVAAAYGPPSRLTREILEYHKRRRPHLAAQIILNVVHD